MKKLLKNILIAFVVFLAIASLFALYSTPLTEPEEITVAQIAKDVNDGKVENIEVQVDDLKVKYKDEEEVKESMKESGVGIAESLINLGVNQDKLNEVDIKIVKESGFGYWAANILPFLIPFLIIGVFIYFMARTVQRGNTRAMSFGQSKAKKYEGKEKIKTSFKDVAGVKEAKNELWEVVQFLKNTKKFTSLGAEVPKGVLLVGPPGTGKTLLARAVAGEANVPFFHISGSEFVEMFVGVGASRVRDLFNKAKKNSPCIIFVDEIDAVGRQRGAGLGGGHDEREQTLNQILTEMDGFEPDTGIIVVAATNRPDVLDPALLRPGRFDRRVMLSLPDIKERAKITEIHARNKPLAEDVNLEKVAQRTPGFSGADLKNLMNEAAITAVKNKRKKITQDDILSSIEKVMLGPERKSFVLSAHEKKIAAYHEAGHALAAHLQPNTDPVHKISIVSRGQAAGYTLKLPDKEKHFHSKIEFLEDLSVLLAGYATEKITFGEVTTGATSDLREATKLARKLVTDYGMSELGPLTFGQKDEYVFLGRELAEQRDYSEKVAAEIDDQVTKIIIAAYSRAEELLTENKDKLKLVADELMKEEVLEEKQFEELVGKKDTSKSFIKSIKVDKNSFKKKKEDVAEDEASEEKNTEEKDNMTKQKSKEREE